MSAEHELREVVVDSDAAAGELLQESAFTDTLAALGAAGGVGSLGSLYYAHAQYRLARANHDAERQALRAQLQAEFEATSRAVDIEWRRLYAETHGLDALDAFDGFGGKDDHLRGFGPEDDFFGGFGVD
jgi:hypothetical protein